MIVRKLYKEFEDIIEAGEPVSIPYETGQRLRREKYKLTAEDYIELDKLLSNEKYTFFVPRILNYQESFPQFLFKGLLDQLIATRNKEFIYPCIRVFGGEIVNSEIQKIISTTSGRLKCNALFVLYYCVDERYVWDEEIEEYETDFSHSFVVDNVTSTIHNNGKYINDAISGVQYFVSNDAFLYNRYNFLLGELLDEENNLIVKYHIKRLLPDKLVAYPEELVEKAKAGIELDKTLRIPRDAQELQNRIAGNYELEKFAFEELKWEKIRG